MKSELNVAIESCRVRSFYAQIRMGVAMAATRLPGWLYAGLLLAMAYL